ncbi:AAA family ATPase [Verrucomicrobiaceae bacterium 5K15]|uniref:AAA family ATPase n=1 Tax=Oceaniferula flava TaxID=2800421 RepID=A0AAE2SF26_9BACT|nr:AAA family ATPase [Oceaniferula flavus]MBK1855744.1 AAA family ATPase [Oceaniferula flavus]MBM1137051.1 AAA family ATPase [Oceaniferula flavus]
MRFDSLNIPAFGPFTQFKLDFPNKDSDLHLLYGPNEAGKSSLLRGINNLLFGIPTRSTDDFVHDYKKMLIGAEITRGDSSLQFFRKKGRANTLVGSDSKVIPDSELLSILGPINEDFFNHMFGLSTESLRKGAESLLSGSNEIGTLLFSASLGGTRIDKAIEQLEQEAQSLAKGGARKNVRIPEAIKRYKDAEKQAKEASISANQWRTLEKEFAHSEQAFQEADAELRKLRQRHDQIRKILTALPLIASREQKLTRLNAIQLPDLADDFQQRVRAAQATHTQSAAALKPSRDSLEQQRATLAAIPDHQTVLDAAPAIEALHQGIQQHLDDLRSLDSAQQQQTIGEKQLEFALSQLGYASAEAFAKSPSMTRNDLTTIKGLVEQLRETENKRAASRQELQNLQQEIKDKSSALEALEEANFPPEHEALLGRAAAMLAELKQLAEKQNRLQQLWMEREQMSSRLSPGSDPAAIRDLRPPSRPAVEKLIKEHAELEASSKEIQRDHRSLEKEIADIDFDLDRFQQSHGRIVTKEDLLQARSQRDQHWQELKSDLHEEKPLSADRLKNFDQKIIEPDRIGDQLLDKADATARAAERRAERDKKKHALGLLAQDLEQAGQQMQEWQDQWTDLTRFLSSRTLSPSELLPWFDLWAKWQELDRQCRLLEGQISETEHGHKDLLGEMRTALKLPGKDLPTLHAYLESAQRRADKTEGQESVLSQDLAKLNSQLKPAQDQLSAATEAYANSENEWKQATAAWKLEGSPAQTLSHLEAHLELNKQLAEQQQAAATLQQLQQQTTEFQKRLQQTVSQILPESKTAPADEQVSALWQSLSEARKQTTRADDLRQEMASTQASIAKLEAQLEQSNTQLQSLASAAKLNSPDGLETAILEHNERLSLRRALADTEEQLVNIAQGQPLEALISTCQESDPQELSEEEDRIGSDIETCQSERDARHESFLKLRDEKSELEKASSAAIDAQQEANNALSEIVTDTQRFISLHHAIDFLKAQIEAYRKQAQGPLVSKTSQYFAKLTCGEFSGVDARPGDSNNVELVALRPNASPDLPAEELATSALSEGSRDQLYLALRLAAIDKHLESHPPMPLILDDVLMTFDDTRTTALLKVLEEFSQKTQVLIFTHHPHNLDLAQQATIPHHPHQLASAEAG